LTFVELAGDAREMEVAMDSASTTTKLRASATSGLAFRLLLAETAVAVQCTLGTGEEEDNRALDQLERSVWTELVLACLDRKEREYLIERARGTNVPPGVMSCRHAARLLVRSGGALLCSVDGASVEDRERIERCVGMCGDGAVRLERIALEAGGA
jgi:hypothetical protein